MKFVKEKLSNVIIYTLMVAVAIFVLVAMIMNPWDWKEEKYCDKIKLDWHNAEGESVKMPFINEHKNEEISATLPDYIEANKCLCIRADQSDLKIYIGDELRMEYNTAAKRIFGKASPRRYLFLRFKDGDAGKTIRMEIFSELKELAKTDAIYYGDKNDIFGEIKKINLIDVSIGVVMFVLGVLTLLVSLSLCHYYKVAGNLALISLVPVFASIWIFCNSELGQIYFSNLTVSFAVDYMMLMLLPFPFLLYFNNIQKKRYNKIYLVMEYIAIVNMIACTIMQATNYRDFYENFLLIAGVFAGSFLFIIALVIYDFFIKKERSYVASTLGLLICVISTVGQIGIFIIGIYNLGGTIVAIGLIIFLAIVVYDTFQRIRQREMERQIVVAEGKAEAAFLANMSHEIRTPLNAVLGMNEMILRESNEEAVKNYAENINNSGTLLLSIINDILDFSKIRSGKMQILPYTYETKQLASEITDMVGARAERKNLKYFSSIDDNVPEGLVGDEVRIKQIIINLLTNAVKYTDEGYVKLSIACDSIKENQAMIHIDVEDSGRGISTEDQATLFDAFTRADEKKNKNIEGTGLGLALVSRLVEAMNGTISVKSEYGKGSVFTVNLPQTIATEKELAEYRKTKEENMARKKANSSFTAPEATVLLVDDNNVNLMVAKELLKRTGTKVVAVKSGEQCLDVLTKKKFDIIFLDHFMPNMDGVETLEKMRKNNLATGVPVIALTANAVGNAKEQYTQLGFNDYLAKPIDTTMLEDILLRYLPEEKVVRD